MKKSLFLAILMSATATLSYGQNPSEPNHVSTTEIEEPLTEAEADLRAIKEFEAKIEANRHNLNDYEGERTRLAERKVAYFKKYGVKPE